MNKTFFEMVLSDTVFNQTGDTQVCCPFPHTTKNGNLFLEVNPSCGINIEEKVYNCLSCGKHGNEIQFIADYLELNNMQANTFRNMLDIAPDNKAQEWKSRIYNMTISDEQKSYIENKLHLSLDVLKELEVYIGYKNDERAIGVPTYIYGELLDVSNYRSGRVPKTIRWKNSTSGLICPFDIWRKTPKDKGFTLICAGEKDMLAARSLGFNAITINGGEGTVPEFFGKEFKGRNVVICYDNDKRGREAGIKVATFLTKYAKRVKNLDISSVCTEDKEDFWDFFYTHNATKKEFLKLCAETPNFTVPKEQTKEYTLAEATLPENINKILTSNVQVVANLDAQFMTPIGLEIEKIGTSEKESENTLNKGEKRFWKLKETNLKDLLYLFDSKLTESKIKSNIVTQLFKLPEKEVGLKISVLEKNTVYRSTVTDSFETTDDSKQIIEFNAYSVGFKLESGKKYKIKYVLVPHPYDGAKLTMIIINAESAEDSVDHFEITEHNKNLLRQFQVKEGQTLDEKMYELIERVKGIVKANYNETLLKTIDLWYNTPLQFKVGNSEPIRAIIDGLLVAESRVGKSSTAEALKETYGLGTIVSFAGSSATEAGLIGGSKLINGTYQTKAGIIPQMHKNAIIFEELGKATNDIMRTLTDVRSSNQVRITRVSGYFSMPAMVRMLALTNTKTGKIPKPISSYPNGIEILTDLIGTPEDIARYDVICILGDRGTKQIDPFYKPMEPYSKESYKVRIRWIWSRKPEDVIITKEVYEYTINKANELNTIYDSYIKIFGTEAWKKIIRVAIAVAGYTVSTNEDFSKIIVKKEHVDYAVNYLVSLYDNTTFRFKEYVDEEKSYAEIDSEGLTNLKNLYSAHAVVLNFLTSNSETNKNNLAAVSGLSSDEFNGLMNSLVKARFVRFAGNEIRPTQRFRQGMLQINTREFELHKLGE